MFDFFHEEFKKKRTCGGLYRVANIYTVDIQGDTPCLSFPMIFISDRIIWSYSNMFRVIVEMLYNQITFPLFKLIGIVSRVRLLFFFWSGFSHPLLPCNFVALRFNHLVFTKFVIHDVPVSSREILHHMVGYGFVFV